MIGQWRQRWQKRQDERRTKKLKERSMSPKIGGWFFDDREPYMLYVLGGARNILVDQGYSLGFLGRQYAHLKRQTANTYSNFGLGKVMVEVNADYAGPLLCNETLRKNLFPRTAPDVNSRGKNMVVVGLGGTITLDGDRVRLEIVGVGQCQRYGFLLYDHPEEPAGRWWCDPLPVSATITTLPAA